MKKLILIMMLSISLIGYGKEDVMFYEKGEGCTIYYDKAKNEVTKENFLLIKDRINTISEIKKEFKRINDQRKKFKITKEDNIEKSTEGSFKNIYRNHKNEVVIVEERVFGETFQWASLCYYKNNKLFFAYTKNYFYNRPITWTGDTIDGVQFDMEKSKILTNRFYFIDGKLAKRIIENKNYEITNFVIDSREF